MSQANARESSPHRRRPLALLGLAVFGSILGLVTAELIARAAFPDWAPPRAERAVFWVYHPSLGWAHNPGQHGRFVHSAFSVDVSINSRGLRDDEYPLARNTKKRMLVLGDSFGWGFGVEQRERFSEILEGRHADWEIINASVSGYGTGQEFLYLKELGLAYKPDVVLLLFCKNDFEDNVSKEDYWHYRPYFTLAGEGIQLQNVPVPPATLGQRIDRLLYGRTYFLARLYELGLGMGASAAAKDPVLRPEVQTRCQITARLLKALGDSCRQEGARFILVSIPMSAERSAPKRACLQDAAAREEIPYLALDGAFAKTEAGLTFPHDEHWTAAGHQAAAQAIDEFLRQVSVF